MTAIKPPKGKFLKVKDAPDFFLLECDNAGNDDKGLYGPYDYAEGRVDGFGQRVRVKLNYLSLEFLYDRGMRLLADLIGKRIRFEKDTSGKYTMLIANQMISEGGHPD